jgi:putative sigma-54 modulation protein
LGVWEVCLEVSHLPISIYSKNIDLNAETEDYIQKKFTRLERHLEPISDSKLEVSKTSARSETARIVAQMTLVTNGHTLRAQERGPTPREAIDAVTDVMDRQVRRFKGKFYRRGKTRRLARNQDLRLENEPADEPEEPSDDPLLEELGTVVRTKRFAMKPITVGEAVMEMELLGHDFFFFPNVDTGDYNVVYRRRDGDHGLIEPERG